MRARVALLTFTATVAALVAAGCSNGSSGGEQTPPPSPSGSSRPSLTPTVSASPTASPSATPTPSFSTTVSASHRCIRLSLTVGQGQGAAGSTILPLVFTNTSHKPCTLYGYPGVSFRDSTGAQVGVDAARSGGEEAVVTLAPNDAANALLRVPDPGNFAPADCKQVTTTSVRAYPPDDTHFVETALAIPVCTTRAGRASVQPVTPGSGG